MAKQPIVEAEQATQKVAATDIALDGDPHKKIDEDFVDAKNSAKKAKVEEPLRASKPATWVAALRAGDDEAFKTLLAQHLRSVIEKHGLSEYEVLFLFDEDSISSYHSDRLYTAASHLIGSGKNILLIIHSLGGVVEPAYLISKTLKRVSGEKFCVAVPRRAKSAATLLALGADEIHMGMISQLGPIDPQVFGLPALALGNALNQLADLVCKYPGAAEMLTKYLINQVPIRTLGFYERVSESAAQYAERLLRGKKLPSGRTEKQVAKHLVEHYKDHGFVIDTEEARELLGDLIKERTPEYRLADELYNDLEFVDLVCRTIHKKRFWIAGSLSDGIFTAKAED